MQQSTRVDARLLVDYGDDGDLEGRVSEIGVHGEPGETRPDTLVANRVLVGVVPSVRDVQRLDGADVAFVGDLVEDLGVTGARGVNGVGGAELDGLEGWVLSAVDGVTHFLFSSWLVGLFCWCKNALEDRLTQDSGVSSVALCGCPVAVGSVGRLGQLGHEGLGG